MTKISQAAFIAVAFAASLAAAPAFADMTTYKATLSGAQEVPPTTSKATGTVEVTYDSAAKKLSWKGSYADLSGAASAAHFHGPAEAGKNAGVEVPVTPVASPFEGSATLTDSQAADLIGGKLYFNIHTAANPNGEVRGQVMTAK